MSARIVTSEEDTGLWSVWRNQHKIGYIFEPQKIERIEARIFRSVFKKEIQFVPEHPRFIALDDWVDQIMPGNPIAGTATWHAALSAVVSYDKTQ